MSQNLFFADRVPVSVAEVRIEGIGVNPLDGRRIDVAVDLAPCLEPITVRLAIVGPDDEEWSSITLIQNREWMLDRVMHLRRDAQPGEYVLHVGIFDGEQLIHHAARRFTFPPPEARVG